MNKEISAEEIAQSWLNFMDKNKDRDFIISRHELLVICRHVLNRDKSNRE